MLFGCLLFGQIPMSCTLWEDFLHLLDQVRAPHYHPKPLAPGVPCLLRVLTLTLEKTGLTVGLDHQ